MNHFNILEEAIQAASAGQGVANRVFAAMKPEGAGYTYLVGTADQMYDHVFQAKEPKLRNFFEIVSGKCHFYTVYEAPWSDYAPIICANLALFTALREIIPLGVVAEIKQNMLWSRSMGKNIAMHVRWEFRSPSGALVMLASPKEAGILFRKAVLATYVYGDDLAVDYSRMPLFYVDKSGCPVCIADPYAYKEHFSKRIAGSFNPSQNGESKGWLVPIHQLDTPREKLVPLREIFLENLVCHVDKSETLPVEILDISKI